MKKKRLEDEELQKRYKLLFRLVKIYRKYKVIRNILWLIINLICIPIIILLYVLKPVKHLKLFWIHYESAIGHLAANTDLLLRRISLNKKNKKNYIGITNNNPANKQLLKMFKREIRIIQVPNIIYKTIVAGIFNVNKKSLFGKSIFYEPLPFNTNEYYEFKNTPSNLSFTKTEEEKGKKLLKNMGLKDKDWFVCFHARDPSYKASKFKKNYNNFLKEYPRHMGTFRNCNIKNHLKAAEYITQQGGML